MKNKIKARARNQYQPNKGKLRKTSCKYYRNLSEDEKIKKKKHFANTKNKNMPDEDRELLIVLKN